MHLDPDSPAAIYRCLVEAGQRTQSPMAVSADGEWTDYGNAAIKEVAELYDALAASTGTNITDAIALLNASGHMMDYFLTQSMRGNTDWNTINCTLRLSSAAFRTLKQMAGPEFETIAHEIHPVPDAPRPQPDQLH